MELENSQTIQEFSLYWHFKDNKKGQFIFYNQHIALIEKLARILLNDEDIILSIIETKDGSFEVKGVFTKIINTIKKNKIHIGLFIFNIITTTNPNQMIKNLEEWCNFLTPKTKQQIVKIQQDIATGLTEDPNFDYLIWNKELQHDDNKKCFYKRLERNDFENNTENDEENDDDNSDTIIKLKQSFTVSSVRKTKKGIRFVKEDEEKIKQLEEYKAILIEVENKNTREEKTTDLFEWSEKKELKN